MFGIGQLFIHISLVSRKAHKSPVTVAGSSSPITIPKQPSPARLHICPHRLHTTNPKSEVVEQVNTRQLVQKLTLFSSVVPFLYVLAAGQPLQKIELLESQLKTQIQLILPICAYPLALKSSRPEPIVPSFNWLYNELRVHSACQLHIKRSSW